MRYFLLLFSVLVFSQQRVSTFVEENDHSVFTNYTKNSEGYYLLTSEKVKNNNLIYWKVFNRQYVITDKKIPFTINGKPFFDYFPKRTFILIEETNNPIKRVDFLIYKKRAFTFYSGEMDVNNLEKGVYGVTEKYTCNFRPYAQSIRLLINDNHFIVLAADSGCNFGYYKFTQEKHALTTFKSPLGSALNNIKRILMDLPIIYSNTSSRYFPSGNGILFQEDRIIFISPKNRSVNNGLHFKNPIQVTYFDLKKSRIIHKKIDIEASDEIDYALVDNQLYLTCNTLNEVVTYGYDLATQELNKINSIDIGDTSFQFKSTSYYLDNDKNKTEDSSAEEWKKELNQTLVLDVDKLENGDLEFTISGARYRDPNGFTKILSTVLIGSITGAMTGFAIAPIWEYGNLQPLLTSTSFVYSPKDGKTLGIGSPKNIDVMDKLTINNTYFQNKKLVGTLNKNVLIFKKNRTNTYIIVDFNQEISEL